MGCYWLFRDRFEGPDTREEAEAREPERAARVER